MTTHTINRTFAKRDGTNLGSVKMEADVKRVSIDGKDLPETSIEYLLTFALQSLQDAYAGKDGKDAQEAFDAKLAKLVSGEIGTRGSGVDPWQSMARRIWRPIMLAALEKQGKTDLLKTYKAGDAEFRNTMVDESIERNRAKVESKVAEERKTIAARLGLAADIEV